MSVAPTIKDIAKRGLECDHKIEEMLSDIWREFEAIEPGLSKALAESFESAEFAALMIIGRFKDQPSVLETLSNKPLSQQDIENLLELSPKFVAQLKEGVAESVRGETTEYTFADQIPLSHQAEQARRVYERELVEIFHKLEKEDPEVATTALQVWEDVNKAATYLASPIQALAGKSPLEAVENGDRQAVIDLLFRIEYGIFS
jgi:hypothetical protein